MKFKTRIKILLNAGEAFRLLKALASETEEYARINHLGNAWNNHTMSQIKKLIDYCHD